MGAALVDTELEVTDNDLTAMAVDKGMMTLVDEAKQAELLTYLQSHQIERYTLYFESIWKYAIL